MMIDGWLGLEDSGRVGVGQQWVGRKCWLTKLENGRRRA